MFRIAICDDMPEFSQQFRNLILNWESKPTDLYIDVFSDADVLICAHTKNAYDILFLDVVMPLLNGIEAAGEIRQQDKSVRIVFLTSSAEFAIDSYIILFHMSACLSEILSKDRRCVCIFAIVPTVYYVFDYATTIYSDLWNSRNPVVMEFLAFTFMIFCFVYYKEYEQKAEALRSEQIIRMAVQQQAKEIQ